MAYVRNASKNRKKVNKNKVYNSVGPKGKVRGLAHQVVDKYNAYAMDAKSSDDPALMHAFFQYAEHYQNIINDMQELEENDKASRGDNNERPQNKAPKAPKNENENASDLPDFIKNDASEERVLEEA